MLDENTRRSIPKETSMQIGAFSVTYKAIWALSAAVVFMFVLGVAVFARLIIIGSVVDFLIAIAYFTLIHFELSNQRTDTVLATTFRKTVTKYHKWRGYSKAVLVRPQLEDSTAVDEQSQASRPYYKMFGRIEFDPYKLGDDDPPLGIVRDRRFHTVSSTMLALSIPLRGVDVNVQEEQLDSYGRVLDSLAAPGHHVHRLAWRQQTFLGEVQHPKELIDMVQTAAGLPRDNLPNQETLIKRMLERGNDLVVHRTTMSLSVYTPDIAKRAQTSGGSKEVLVRQLRSLYTAVAEAELGLQHAHFLDYNELVMENLLALDPVRAQPIWQNRLGVPDGSELVSEFNAWPEDVDFTISDHWCWIGKTCHMGFYGDEFNPSGIHPEQFAKFMRAKVPKTVTVVVQMLPERQAQRQAEWKTNSMYSSNREQLGFGRRVTAASEVQESQAAQHEREIAEEEGRVGRTRLFVDVTGASPEEVQANAAIVVEAAELIRLLLEPLTGRQYQGVMAAMPLARGIPEVRLSSWV